jgi:outer membrane protein
MRKTLSTWVAVLVLCGALQAQASASFANRMLGISFSAFTFVPRGSDTISFGVPIALEAGYYIESGFDLYLRVQLSILSQQVGFGPEPVRGEPGVLFGIGGQLGVRYLFLEESIRPYVGVHLAGMGFPSDRRVGPAGFGGLGASLGVDFFASDSISIGLRGYTDLLFSVDNQGRFVVIVAPGGGLNFATYF